jgi:hypothetical protein
MAHLQPVRDAVKGHQPSRPHFPRQLHLPFIPLSPRWQFILSPLTLTPALSHRMGEGGTLFGRFTPGGAPRVIPGATIFGPNGAPHFAALCAVGGARSRNNPVVKRSPGSTELAEVSSLPSTARRRRADLAPGVDWSGPPLQSPRLRMNAISGFQRHSAELPPRDSGFLGFFICWLTQSGLWRKIQELVGGVGKSPKSQVQRPKVLAHRSFRTGTMGARSLTIESDVETLNR